MTSLLLLLLLSQTPAQPDSPLHPDERDAFHAETRVGLQLDQGFERYEGDARLFLSTHLGADFKASDTVWLRAGLSRIDKFGRTGFGTGIQADIRVTERLRLLPGVSIGDPEVLAVSSVGLGALYSGLDLWRGFVLTGGVTLYSFSESRSAAVTLGAVQYYRRFWFQYTFRAGKGFNVDVPGLSHSLGVGARFQGPVRWDLGVSAGHGNEAYLATYIQPPVLVELHGFNAGASAKLWVLPRAGLLLSARMGKQYWKKDDTLAFSRRSASLGLWAEL